MQDLLEKAIHIAVQAHRGQRRRDGSPYILHPLRVMFRLEDPLDRTVAILHDVVEDSEWTLDALRQEGFPEEVLKALDCVTKREGESYAAFVERSGSNPVARRVKLADLEDNMNLRELKEIAPADAERLAKYLGAWHRLRGPGKGESGA